MPQIDVRIRPDAAARLGLTPGDVRRAATTLVKGLKVGELYDQQKIFDVFVWGDREGPRRPLGLRDLPIETPAWRPRPARRRGRRGDRPGAQRHHPRERVAEDRHHLQRHPGADLGQVARAIEAKVKAVPLDREYHPEFLGEYAARAESRRRLLTLAAL